MKTAVIYYSNSGNTKKAAITLAEYLKQKGEVDLLELKASDESDNFLGQCRRAFLKIRAQLEPVNLDLKAYDLLCFGSPVWAFGPAPAMNSYLDKCFGLESKDAVIFTTFGSGTGNDRCLNYIKDILNKKGIKSFKQFSIPQIKINDFDYVSSKIKELGL